MEEDQQQQAGSLQREQRMVEGRGWGGVSGEGNGLLVFIKISGSEVEK